MASTRIDARTRHRIAELAKERHVAEAALVWQAIEQSDGQTLWERVAPLIGRKGSGRSDLSANKARLAGFGG
ncbi:MAG: hypothetical protein Q8S33_28765 [Myxococcales bacterium]|nr:hypothetical protein [Myxococcales bacterium]